MTLSKSLLAACLLQAAAAASVRHALMADAAREWVRGPRAAPHGSIDLMLGVRQPAAGKHALEAALYAAADPSQPTYGRHLGLDAANELLRPADADTAIVREWLLQHGIADVTLNQNGDILCARTTIAVAERLLGAEYYEYVHATMAAVVVVRCESYEVPANVSDALDFIGPTTRFPRPSTLRRRTSSGASLKNLRAAAPDAGVTPTYIRTQYAIGTVESTQSSNRQQAAGFLGEFAAQADLQAFYASFYPIARGRKLAIVGPNQQNNPGLEASLDVQYLTSIGGNVNSTYWYTDGQRPYGNEPFLAWLQNITALPAALVPYVISVSYGDNENTVDYAYASRVNTEFQKLGAAGTSILYSSGDGGVGGSQPSSCTTFIPNFPAASPYVTAVGATENTSPEVAAAFSSGGFSNYWPMPQYQTTAVAQYFKVAQHLPPANLYNASGAGFPDVAAFGTAFNIVIGGGTTQVDGTSCSAPTFAGIISLLNDLRIAAGKSTLGWLNPLFYQSASVFTDVTEGNNPGCSSQGFFAAPGWDPVTGLGTPNYEKLKALVLSLP